MTWRSAPQVRHIEANATGAVRSTSGWPFPPCIVIERGESLDKWAERLKPDFPTILQARTRNPPNVLDYGACMSPCTAASPSAHAASQLLGRQGPPEVRIGAMFKICAYTCCLA